MKNIYSFIQLLLTFLILLLFTDVKHFIDSYFLFESVFNRKSFSQNKTLTDFIYCFNIEFYSIDTKMANDETKPYFERQRLQLCALHSLNNLFQKAQFNKQALDDIVRKYDKSWCWNEYATFYTGNYDLTIILDALESKQYTLRAIDKGDSLEDIPFEECFGLLLNTTIERPFFDRLPLIRSLTKPGRHWSTIKMIGDDQYYDFDSKLREPRLIGNKKDLINCLEQLRPKDSYIYMVIEQSKVNLFEPNEKTS